MNDRKISLMSGILSAALLISLVTILFPTPVFAGSTVHARTVEYQGADTECDRKKYHPVGTTRTRECSSIDYPVSAWVHASMHRSKFHGDGYATVGAGFHAHHGFHSTSACMKGAIEDHYFGSNRADVQPLSSSEDEMPARFEFKISVPPTRDEPGNLVYTSTTTDKGEKGGIVIDFAPESRLQVDSRALRPGQTGIAVFRVCVASEDGERHQDGLVELLLADGNQRLRLTGLFEGLELKATRKAAYEGVWTVELGKARIAVGWLKHDGVYEMLTEGVANAD